MNLKKLGRTFWVIAAVAIMAMVLQGCGGDDGVNPTTHEDLQDMYDELKDDYDQAVEDRDTAQRALGEETDAADMNGSAHARLKYYMMQLGSMDDAADMNGSAYAQVNYYMMMLGSMDDAADMSGSAYAQRNHYMAMLGSMDDAADMNGSAYAQVNYYKNMIGSSTDAADMNGSLHAQLNYYKDMIGSPTDAADMNGSLHAQLNYYKEKDQAADDKAKYDKAKAVNTAIRAASGTAPTYTVEATATDLVVKSTGYTDGGAESGLPADWRGMTLNKDDDMLVVYSDIADATPTLLGLLYNGTVMNNVRMYNVDEIYHMNGTGVMAGEIQLSDIMRDSNTITTDDKGTSDPADDVRTAMGSVRGVPGSFSCTGTGETCDLPERASTGKLTLEAETTTAKGQWTFTPTDPNAMVNVQDTAYLSLGWWLGKNTDGSYSFDTIAMGHGDLMYDYGMENEVAGETVPAPTVDTIDGKATYKGAAAGKYSMVDTVEDTASAGHWTASATLMADFDVDNDTTAESPDADDDGVSLSGEITNFMSEGESLSNWKVTLKAIDRSPEMAGIQAPTDFMAQMDAVAEWSRGGAAMGTGTWTYTFQGLAGTTGVEADNTAQPGAVTGDFSASVGQRAHIVGAFGATMTTEE